VESVWRWIVRLVYRREYLLVVLFLGLNSSYLLFSRGCTLYRLASPFRWDLQLFDPRLALAKQMVLRRVLLTPNVQIAQWHGQPECISATFCIAKWAYTGSVDVHTSNLHT